MEAYQWNNRVKFITKYMFDIDNNGYLDLYDFECLALRYTVLGGKGSFDPKVHEKNKVIMINFWNDMAEFGNFNKNGQVSIDDFTRGLQNVCVGKKFSRLPNSVQDVITCKFNTIDLDGKNSSSSDGLITLEEYRLDCISWCAYKDISDIDDCYHKLLSEEDKMAEGISLKRYQELYAQFLGSPGTEKPGVYLFGPISYVGN